MLNRLPSLGSPAPSRLARCAVADQVRASANKSARASGVDLRPICEIAAREYDQPDDADRADRCGDYVRPRCDGDVGVHDGADLEQLFIQRLSRSALERRRRAFPRAAVIPPMAPRRAAIAPPAHRRGGRSKWLRRHRPCRRRAVPPGYTNDTAQSGTLTSYLQSHRLPLVGAQVLTNSSGNQQIILYGFVATDFGKQDAADKARRYLHNPNAPVINRIAVRPELATGANGSAPAAPSVAMLRTDRHRSSEISVFRIIRIFRQRARQCAELPGPAATGTAAATVHAEWSAELQRADRDRAAYRHDGPAEHGQRRLWDRRVAAATAIRLAMARHTEVRRTAAHLTDRLTARMAPRRMVPMAVRTVPRPMGRPTAIPAPPEASRDRASFSGSL